jgi:pimeloyl-ACP methyl ester carboxylesterase
MTSQLTLSRTVDPRPLDQWAPVSAELLGTQTRLVHGPRWQHRIIECGEGEPLVLIHGVGGHAETFARNMHALGRHFRVIAIDALYHGYSSKQPYDEVKRYDLQVDALVDLLDALGLAWAHVEGESMGAQIAFEFGLRYPDRAGKLVMNTGVGRVKLAKSDFPIPEGDYAELAELSAKAILEPGFEIMRRRLEWLVLEPERMTDEMAQIRLRLYEDPEINASMRRYFSIGQGKEDPWDITRPWGEADVKRFRPESLVFWTAHNPGEGPELGEYFANLVPGCQFYLMEDAAHWPQWERPEEHDQVLIDFIGSGR